MIEFFSRLYSRWFAAVKGQSGQETLLSSRLSRQFVGVVVVEGELTHEHMFLYVEWDSVRLGPAAVDFDDDHGSKLEFPMVTYKQLYRCSCGREIVESTRALI